MATGGDNASAQVREGRRVNRRSQSEDRGGGRSEAPAPVTVLGRVVDRYRKSVWAPVASKALGIVAGMVALACIGASSIARGSGTPTPSASPAAEARPVEQVHALMGAPSHALAHEHHALAQQADAGVEAGAESDAGGPAPSAGLTADGRVILNLASFDDLRKLRGVGPKKAQAILDLRAKLGGRFRRLNDLLRVKGIGVKTLAKLKEKIVLDPPPPS